MSGITVAPDDSSLFGWFEDESSTTSDTILNNDSVIISNDTSVLQAPCNDPGAYLEVPVYRRERLIVDVGLTTTLCLLGLVGNCLSFCVLLSLLKRKNTGTTSTSGCRTAHVLLCTLSVADSCYLLTSVFLQAGLALYHYSKWFENTLFGFPVLIPWLFPLASTTQTISSWLMVAITWERWLAICHPLRSRRASGGRKSFFLVFFIILGAILFNVPTALELRVTQALAPCDPSIIRWKLMAPMALNTYYRVIYKNVLCLVMRSILPLITLTVLNIQLLGAIRSSTRMGGRTHSKGQEQQEKRSALGLTCLIITMVSIFIVCEVPDCIYRIMMTVALSPKVRYNWLPMALFGSVVNFMLVVNSAVNFIVYFFMGKEFRKGLHSLCGTNPPGGGYTSQTHTRTTTSSTTRLTSVTKSSPKQVNAHLV